MTDPAEIRAGMRRMLEAWHRGVDVGLVDYLTRHADVLLADPAPEPAEALTRVRTLMDAALEWTDSGGECADFITAALATLTTLADPAPVGLTEGERKIVEAGRHGYHHVLYQLVAIIDRLVPVFPSVDPEEEKPVCSHGIYHHGCPSCDERDPEQRRTAPDPDVCAICCDVECDGLGCIADLDVDDPTDHPTLERLQEWVRVGRTSSTVIADLCANVDRLRAERNAAEAERDEWRIIVEGCGCPAPYDQCPHDEPLTSEVKRLRAERDAALARAVPDGWKVKWNIHGVPLLVPAPEEKP